MSFENLGLSPKVLAAVKAAGYETPTPIQEQAIPFAVKGRDVLGIAQTGTGKTASFVLPMLTRLERGRARARMPRSLILEPTRELAAQVAQSFEAYGAQHNLTVALLIGGVSFVDQNRKLDRGADVLIATPGRLLDHFERGRLLLTGVEVLVVDEADRMLDMGFIPDIERIVKLTPFTRQTLFFSATMPPEIQRLTEAFLSNPERIEATPPSTTGENISQFMLFTPCDPKQKRAALRKAISGQDVTNGIIFCNRKRDVRVVQKSLRKHGFDSAELHGDLDQHVRLETLGGFRDGKVKLLVASDVAARGLDIPAVSHIFNYDVPFNAEDYVHRIGRTGRAGREGMAITLVTPQCRQLIGAVEQLTKQKFEWLGDAPDDADWEARPRGARDAGGRRADGAKRARPAGRGQPAQRAKQKSAPKPARAGKPAPGNAAPKKANARRSPCDSGKKSANNALGDNVPAFLRRPV